MSVAFISISLGKNKAPKAENKKIELLKCRLSLQEIRFLALRRTRASGCRRSRRWSVCWMGTLPRGSLHQLTPSAPGLKMLAVVLWPRAGSSSVNPLWSPCPLCLQLSVSIIPTLSTSPILQELSSLLPSLSGLGAMCHPSLHFSGLSSQLLFPRNNPDSAQSGLQRHRAQIPHVAHTSGVKW